MNVYGRIAERKYKIHANLRFACLLIGILFVFWALYNISGASPQVAVNDNTISEVSFASFPLEGEEIGILRIPALEKVLPIFQGTSDETLDKGVGHYTQSMMPGDNDNVVLSGHRDTVFTKLGDLKIGDQLIVETVAGIFTYEINGTRIVDKDDRTVIVPTDTAVLTLTTCYPFYFVGKAPDRYIVTADLILKE